MKTTSTKKSQALWEEAKTRIPGGTQLLSKRAEMFLPEKWPAYMKKARGVRVTDLDGNTYIDMSIMNVGACILGYADPDVNRAVKNVIDKSSTSTLNSPEEVELANLLIKLHPWADMARFARSGGEACAIAIRIARAYTEKDKIAFCGYHGWHDWYLSANIADKKNLDGHLLPGLNPLGVPRVLARTSLPFHYNKIEELEEIVKNNDIGVIIMEPIRHQEPQNNFLQKVRKIADRIKAVLIFDEVSSGFRLTVGGAHLCYGVNPDIAIFSKAMSNGFPMAAVIGKKRVMNKAQESFISSTAWTERIGPAAAIATIKKMQKNNVPRHLHNIGESIKKGWERIARKYNLAIAIIGPNPLITFSFNHPQSQELKTLFTQEMLKKGFLAGLTVYVSYAHETRHIKTYLKAVDEVFFLIKKAVSEKNITKFLEGPSAHTGFHRLT